ncbi:MAG: redox-sensing transcriptional repressor Rex [Deltaproteobacteria bacterium]|nr:redox-sensing transcriptional repressor Rex [Deltaproteobacteria bacterium]MBW2306248.1 redox-sensing transcriptional repressor Rex [Deltaproteobacteria bacterium]
MLQSIPRAVIRRLPLYYEFLSRLTNEGAQWVSSKRLAEELNITHSCVRQDMVHLGPRFASHYGYSVAELSDILRNILGLEKDIHIVIVGAGRIGQALSHYPGFRSRGFRIMAMFDVNPDLMGKTADNVPVYPLGRLDEIVRREKVLMGVVAVPMHAAQEAALRLVEAGITAILNFAPISLKVPDYVTVQNVHISAALLELSFQVMGLRKDRKE